MDLHLTIRLRKGFEGKVRKKGVAGHPEEDRSRTSETQTLEERETTFGSINRAIRTSYY
jgi:hypothetical protein